MISGMSNALEQAGSGHTIPAERAPTAEQRSFLQNRLDELGVYLRRATDAEIVAEVGVLTLVMAAQEGSVGERSATLRAYEAVLRGIPLVALKKAVEAYLSGARGDGHWAPRPGELLNAARDYVRAPEADFAKIHRIVHATVLPSVDPRRQAKVLELAAETVKALRKSSDPYLRREPYRLPTIQEAETNLERLRSNIPEIKLSDEARAAMGILPASPVQSAFSVTDEGRAG